MKKRTFLFVAIAAMGLCSCGGNKLSPKAGDFIYTRTPYIDMTDLPATLHFEVEIPGAITRIQIGTQIMLSSKHYAYANGVLSIDTSVLKDANGEYLLSPGDQPIRIYADKTVMVSCFFASKVIKTADDLLAINQGGVATLQGAYILGNDIDCSSIENFEPIGFSDTQDGTHYNHQFNGVFDGNGYKISGVRMRYSDDPSSYESIYNGNYLFNDPAHRSGNGYGFFQDIGSAGIVRNVVFDDVSITGRTIVGVVAGMVSGKVENVIVNENCRALMSTHFYDESCALGGIAGIVSYSSTASVEHCLSLVSDLHIVDEYVDYDDDAYFIEDGGETHTFYNGPIGWIDSNGKEANNIYSGVGLTYGSCTNCFGKEFIVSPTGLPADFSQTHIEANKEKDGPDIGSVIDCEMKSESQLKTPTTYAGYGFDEAVWNFKEGIYPSFKAIYPYRVAA